MGLRLLASRSSGPELLEIDPSTLGDGKTKLEDCLFVPDLLVRIKLDQIEKQGYWIVNTLFSEVIEFRKTLKRGRNPCRPLPTRNAFCHAKKWGGYGPRLVQAASLVFSGSILCFMQNWGSAIISFQGYHSVFCRPLICVPGHAPAVCGDSGTTNDAVWLVPGVLRKGRDFLPCLVMGGQNHNVRVLVNPQQAGLSKICWAAKEPEGLQKTPVQESIAWENRAR